MKTVLVTAGGTFEPVDAVRMLGNRSTGATGSAIALAAHERGWNVTLLLSHHSPCTGPWPFEVIRFVTHHDLERQMQERIHEGRPTAVIHSAAVADYQVAGVYPGDSHGPKIDPAHAFAPEKKIPGSQQSLWLKLTPLPKILGKIRKEWRFSGLLVSFKLEQGTDLFARARENLIASGSDLVVANTWEDHTREAFLMVADRHGLAMQPINAAAAGIPTEQKIPRQELPARIMKFLESCHVGSPVQ